MTTPAPLRERIKRVGPGRYQVASDRATGRTYAVQVNGEQGVCNCQGFTAAAAKGGVCKHVRECIAEERKHEVTTETQTEERNAEAVADERALTPIKVIPTQAIVPTGDQFDGMKRLSKHLVAAGGVTVPKALDTPSKVLTVVYAGWELGVKPMTAIRHIHLINGRCEPSAQLKMGIVMAAEPDAKFEILESTHEIARIRFSRPSRGMASEFQYTIDDAKRSGQASKPGPWKEYTNRMLMWSAINIACRLAAPDLINSVTGDLAAGVEGFGGDEAPEPDDDVIEVQSRDVTNDADLYNEGDSPDEPTEAELTDVRSAASAMGEVTESSPKHPQPAIEAMLKRMTPAQRKQLIDDLNTIAPDCFNAGGLRIGGRALTDKETARVWARIRPADGQSAMPMN